MSEHGPKSDAELRGKLVPVVRLVAGTSPIAASSVQAMIHNAEIHGWSAKRRTKLLLELATDYRARVQFGRFRAALLVGISDLGDGFLTTFERSGLLLADGLHSDRFGRFLAEVQEELGRSADDRWEGLRVRISTYHAYCQLSRDIARGESAVRGILTSRHRHTIKKVLSLVNLAFLRHYFQLGLPEDLEWRLEQLGTAEEIGSICSALFVRANEFRPVDCRDLAIPAVDDFADEDLWASMDYGQALVAQHKILKKISLFGYRLMRYDGPRRRVYRVLPPSREFEYALSLGYMRAQINSGWLGISKLKDVPEVSLASIADLFLKGFRNRISQLMDEGTPLRRIRLEFPMHPDLLRLITEVPVFDDIASRESLAQEFMFPVRLASEGPETPEAPMPLTPVLSIDDFMRIWRLLRFMALVDIASIRPYAESDKTVFLNSTVRISRVHEMVDLISAMGFDAEKVSEFFRLTSANVAHLGYFDIQYKPFVQIAQTEVPALNQITVPEMVHLSAVVATGNVLRNVQVTNKLRLHYVAAAFVEVVANWLKVRFGRVVTNRRVQGPSGATDIDIVVWADETLYLFECKHSVAPAELHETRDAWEDIERGVLQLRRSSEALSVAQKLHDYLAGWFPGKRLTGALRISPCVLSSHRIFSGMHYEGIPVRDFASFSKLLDDGVISVATGEDASDTLVQRFRLTEGDEASTVDLDNYLSPDSRYFKMFSPFQWPVSKLTVLKNFTIAHETCVYEATVDEWIENLEAIGAKRLPDERRPLKIPLTMDEILEKIEKSKDARSEESS